MCHTKTTTELLGISQHNFNSSKENVCETNVGKNFPIFKRVLTGVSMLGTLVSERVTSTTLKTSKKKYRVEYHQERTPAINKLPSFQLLGSTFFWASCFLVWVFVG